MQEYIFNKQIRQALKEPKFSGKYEGLQKLRRKIIDDEIVIIEKMSTALVQLSYVMRKLREETEKEYEHKASD